MKVPLYRLNQRDASGVTFTSIYPGATGLRSVEDPKILVNVTDLVEKMADTHLIDIRFKLN